MRHSRGPLVTRAFRFFLSFQGLLWTFTLAAVLFLCALPLARNLWAYYTWERVPCTLSSEGLFAPEDRKYFFQRDGVRWSAFARDFWDRNDLDAIRTLGTQLIDPPNMICYVSHDARPRAVLYLDAHQHLERALPRFGVSSFLIAAAAILSRAAKKRRLASPANDPARKS
jgi:hypothetical protein